LASEPEAGTTATEEAPAETPPPSPRHGEIVEALREALGDGFLEDHYSAHEAWVRVAPGSWRESGRLGRDRLGLTYLTFVAGIDWKQAPDLGAQKIWDPEAEPTEDPGDGPGHWSTGVAGGETRFQVFARLYDVVHHAGLTLKVDAGDGENGAPRAESWVPLFRGAEWHEREAWEMYGIDFEGHPGLRHLYLPGEFEGFPLRKDFPLLAREVKPWPGLVNVEGLPGEDDAEEAAEDG
jgi:NADH-quinone oxidoreductase subunit C